MGRSARGADHQFSWQHDAARKRVGVLKFWLSQPEHDRIAQGIAGRCHALDEEGKIRIGEDGAYANRNDQAENAGMAGSQSTCSQVRLKMDALKDMLHFFAGLVVDVGIAIEDAGNSGAGNSAHAGDVL